MTRVFFSSEIGGVLQPATVVFIFATSTSLWQVDGVGLRNQHILYIQQAKEPYVSQIYLLRL